MRPKISFLLAVPLMAALCLSGAAPANAVTKPVPLPSALAGHPYVKTFPASELSGPAWNRPANAPGNCNANPAQVSLNSAGNAQLTTTGEAGNCTSVQSPHKYPTHPGYVYEARVYFSSMLNWSAWWMYGEPWPDQGEIDAFEPQYGASYVSWHSRACSRSAASSTIGTDPWSYACKSTVSASGPGIAAGWHTIDIAFTVSAVQVWYDGHLYVSVPETLTGTTNDQMWITFSEGSCNALYALTCAPGGEGKAGNVQVAWLRAFT